MPRVDLCLQIFPPGQQLAVARRQVDKQLLQPLPELLTADTGTGKDLPFQQLVQFPCDLQAAFCNALAH